MVKLKKNLNFKNKNNTQHFQFDLSVCLTLFLIYRPRDTFCFSNFKLNYYITLTLEQQQGNNKWMKLFFLY